MKDVVVQEGVRRLATALKAGDFAAARETADWLLPRVSGRDYPNRGWHLDAADMVAAIVRSTDLSEAIEQWNAVVHGRMEISGEETSELEIPPPPPASSFH